MSLTATITSMAQAAKKASQEMGRCTATQKNDALLKIAALIEKDAGRIQEENQKDLVRAKEMGLSPAMLDRLTISDTGIASMAKGLCEVAAQEDPIGTYGQSWQRPNGLQVARMTIPLGVIGIIYESRPNVTIDAAGLCLKAGNATLLRGGSEAFHSNMALAESIQSAFKSVGLPEAAVQVVPVRDREAVNLLLAQEAYVDLIIPRGGEGLIRFVVENSKIPVLKHYKGVCHVYVDKGADIGMATEIAFNSKVQRPGVCNAMETLLVHREIAGDFLPQMAERFQSAQVLLKGCPAIRDLLPDVSPAEEADWYAEYLDLILAVKVVNSMDEAIDHMATYGSQHTETIVTNDYARAKRFLREVDSSVVMVNASTRFNDGGQLGLGAEIGISTSKLHAFGPMGVKELTTTKFVVLGDGQVRT